MASTATLPTSVTGPVSGADIARHRRRSLRAPSVWPPVSADQVPATITSRDDLLRGFAAIGSSAAARMLDESLFKAVA